MRFDSMFAAAAALIGPAAAAGIPPAPDPLLEPRQRECSTAMTLQTFLIMSTVCNGTITLDTSTQQYVRGPLLRTGEHRS